MGEVLSDGTMVTFSGKSNPKWLKDAERDLIKADEELKRVNKEIAEFESNIGEEIICQINRL